MNIVKSVGVFVLLCIAYSLFVSTVHIKNYQPLNQFQGNAMAIEDLLYSDLSGKTNFLVGSSLTYRLRNHFFPNSFQNMAIGGSTSARGLQKILKKGVAPKILLVETNFISRSNQKGAISASDRVAAPTAALKQYLPITRQKNQPVSFMFNLLAQEAGLSSSREQPKGERAMAIMMEQQQEVCSKEVFYNEETYASLQQYQELIGKLQEQGTCIIFMEMPIDCRLAESTLAVSTRAVYRQAFPPDMYQYITLPSCEQVTTTDGIHLTAESAKFVAKDIISQISKIDCI